MEENKKVNTVTVRWWDGYKEDFRATEVRFGSDLLWMRLEDGNNRHIPMRMVRWFGTSIESHQNTGMQKWRNRNDIYMLFCKDKGIGK